MLAAERARKREDLLAATEKLLAPVIARVQAGRLAGAAQIGVKAGELINKHKMAKHFDVAITDDSLAITRRQAQIDEEAQMDGLYVIRTPLSRDELDAPGVVTAYKNLKHVERDFRQIKSDDLDLLQVTSVFLLRGARRPEPQDLVTVKAIARLLDQTQQKFLEIHLALQAEESAIRSNS